MPNVYRVRFPHWLSIIEMQSHTLPPYCMNPAFVQGTKQQRLPKTTIPHIHEVCYCVLHRSGIQGFVSLDP